MPRKKTRVTDSTPTEFKIDTQLKKRVPIGNEAPETSAPDGGRASNSPPEVSHAGTAGNTNQVERPAAADPTQTQGAQAMPAPTTQGASGAAAGGSGPVPGESPPGQAPTLELTPQNLAQVINTLAKNDQVFLDEIKRLREEVSSMRGGYSQKRIDPNYDPRAPQQGQPQEMPGWVKEFTPLVKLVVAKFLGPDEEAKPRSRIAELVEAKLANRLDSMIEKSLQNISDLMDAEVEGRVMVQPKKENDHSLEAPK